MIDRCEPPEEWRHERLDWIDNQGTPIVGHFVDGYILTAGGKWYEPKRISTERAALIGYTYVAPCRPDDGTERARLEAENARLRGLIRAILAADERGQGLPFADAMDAAQEAVYGKRT